MLYDALLDEAKIRRLYVKEVPLSPRTKGLYADNVVWINKNLDTRIAKRCALAEEIGHSETTSGDIIDQLSISNRKQELRARQWAYQKLVPLEAIVEAYKAHTKGRHEIAEYLDVTEEFLQASIDRYTEKYGLFVVLDKQYTIYFDPLGVLKMFSE